ILELMHLSDVALALHRGVELEDIAPLVASILEKALHFGIGGVALTSYGEDRTFAVVRGEVSEREVRHVADEAAGRKPGEVHDVHVASHLGEIVDDSSLQREWTVLSVPLAV